jgi:hypothetical protein
MSTQKHPKKNFKSFFNVATFLEQPILFSKNQSNKEKSNQKAMKTKEIWKNKGKNKQICFLKTKATKRKATKKP